MDLRDRDFFVILFSLPFEEHARLRHHLSKISHRFRIYLLLVFIVVTSSQFATLFQITEFRDKVTFINGGDFAVSSIAQVVGVILCLNAAAKISHRAQGIAALASRWHALASCENDMEAMSYAPLPSNAQLTSYLSSYHGRQSFRQPYSPQPNDFSISRLFEISRKGDYYMYLAEFKSGNVKKEAANQSLKAYQVSKK
ncbi:neuropeptides B/W receptor type like protein [Tanacetum coccineum]